MSFYEPFYSKPLGITNENENTDKAKQYMTAKEELRNCSAQLRGFSEILPCLHIGVPAKKDISKAADQLLILSCTVVDSIWERLSDKYREPTSQDAIDAVNEATSTLTVMRSKRRKSANVPTLLPNRSVHKLQRTLRIMSLTSLTGCIATLRIWRGSVRIRPSARCTWPCM